MVIIHDNRIAGNKRAKQKENANNFHKQTNEERKKILKFWALFY